MNEERKHHAAVSMGNKMFVIGGYHTTSCEVFDSISKKFTLIKSFSNLSTVESSEFSAVCIANDIIILHEQDVSQETKMYRYDVDKQTWSNVDYIDQDLLSIIHNDYLLKIEPTQIKRFGYYNFFDIKY